MKLDLPQFVLNILRNFSESGFEIYIVGGAVRDLLMGKDVGDWDFTTNAKPEDILKLFPEGFYDNKFGTVGLPLKKVTDDGSEIIEIYEITTYRTEAGYTDRRHPDMVLWGKTLEEDLARRDFTINAMAIKPMTNDQFPMSNGQFPIAPSTSLGTSLRLGNFQLIDPYEGQKDIQNKLIRAVGDASSRFNEDALRIMRCVRIATELGFLIEEKTFQAIKEKAFLLSEISGERIRDELLKIMASEHPTDGVMILHNGGVLEVILPELEKGVGLAQAKHHIHDVFKHSVESLRNCPSSDSIVRLATLLHDVGKSYTYKGEGAERTFFNHEVESARIARDIAQRLHFSKEQRDKFATLIRWHQFSVDEFQTDKAIRRFIVRVGNKYLGDIFDVRIGDRLGSGCTKAESWRLKKYKQRTIDVQKHIPSVKDLKVNGKDVMEVLGIGPGPKVGEILNKLFEEITEDSTKNEREYLIKRIKKLK